MANLSWCVVQQILLASVRGLLAIQSHRCAIDEVQGQIQGALQDYYSEASQMNGSCGTYQSGTRSN